MKSTVVGGYEPRLFWRRAFAFWLDLLIAYLVVGILFAAVDAAAGTSLGDSSLVSGSECNPAPASHPQVARVEKMWPLPGGWQRENTVCQHGGGGKESWTFTTRVRWKEGSINYSKELTYDIDKSGNALPMEYAPDFRPFAILLLFVVFAADRWRSPGKSITGLRIMTVDGGQLGWQRAFLREALKLSPLLTFGGITIWAALAPPVILTDSEVSLVAMRDGFLVSPQMLFLYAFCVGSSVWWFGPFIVWRGRTWYDAFAGSKVVRTDRTPTSGRQRP